MTYDYNSPMSAVQAQCKESVRELVDDSKTPATTPAELNAWVGDGTRHGYCGKVSLVIPLCNTALPRTPMHMRAHAPDAVMLRTSDLQHWLWVCRMNTIFNLTWSGLQQYTGILALRNSYCYVKSKFGYWFPFHSSAPFSWDRTETRSDVHHAPGNLCGIFSVD